MPADRLTDEQVAWYAGASGSRWNEGMAPEFDIVHLAREVQECRALRPDCPTCEGTGELCCDGDSPICPPCQAEPCPNDCTDGKMPLDKWVALLVETLQRTRPYVAARRVGDSSWMQVLGSLDAVLKMVPK